MRDETHVDLSVYRPLAEDEAGLTPHQIQERRIATRLVFLRRYDVEMNRESAERITVMPVTELMRRLEIDKEQGGDLKRLAKRHLERCEQAGAR